MHWGANVDRFGPNVERKPLPIPDDRSVVVFSGSFRPWHGADMLVRCAAKLPDAFFLFVGDGPRLGEAIALADELGVSERVLFTGAVPYDEVPAYLKWADVGVAPYQPARLGPMQLGFFWSPLKIFEYMAMGLPVVSLDVAPLREIVRESEGTLVSEGDIDGIDGMAEAIRVLVDDTASARAKGRSAENASRPSSAGSGTARSSSESYWAYWGRPRRRTRHEYSADERRLPSGLGRQWPIDGNARRGARAS